MVKTKEVKGLLKKVENEYGLESADVSRLLAYSLREDRGRSCVFVRPVDYLISLDRYVKEWKKRKILMTKATKDGIVTYKVSEPMTLISFLSYIGHNPNEWGSVKEKSELFLNVLETIETYFAADITGKALVGAYDATVALKSTPQILSRDSREEDGTKVNISVNTTTGLPVSLV